MNIRNVCVLYPGGAGGNHLANLISLAPGFVPRFSSQNYEADMLEKYGTILEKNTSHRGINAHFSDNHHLDGLHMLKERTGNVFNGHWHCYHAAIENRTFKKIIDPFWFVLDYPKDNTFAQDRITALRFSEKNKNMYTLPTEINGHIIADGILLSTEKFMSDEGSEYIRKTMRDCFQVELPKVADLVHEHWLRSIRNAVKLYKKSINTKNK